MKLKVLWPGKTSDDCIRKLEEFYHKRIRQLGVCEIIATREARGLTEKEADRIKKIEAEGLEKHIKDDYIVCLSDRGQEMNSQEMAQFLERVSVPANRFVTFIVGGFLGLEDRLLKRAHVQLSLSRMTFSHELCRLMLLEQLYRSMSIIKSRKYAK